MNTTAISDKFILLHNDAILWKYNRLWSSVKGPDEQADAVDSITQMLLCINNETKRSAYIKEISDNNNFHVKSTANDIKSAEEAISDIEKAIKKLLARKNKSEEHELQIEKLQGELSTFKDSLAQLQEKKQVNLPESTLKKAVNKAISDKAAKDASTKMKAQFELKIRTKEDAGMPDDFKGTMQDVFDALKYGIYEHEDVYYSRGAKGDYPISNFTMKILYHVNTSEDSAFRLIAVKNVYGFEVVINLNTDDFVALGSFKKVLARKGDYVFKGTDADLTRLQEFLQKDELKTELVKTLGYHSRGMFWSWSNGIMPLEPNTEGNLDFIPVDEYGIVNYQNKNYFIPGLSKMFADKDDMFVNEKKFKFINPINNFGFNEWATLMDRTYGHKSIPCILFYIGSLFRDITMKQIQRYPMLNLFGPPGAGKGQMAESIMTMFGEKQDQIMLGGASTVVGFMRKFAQFRNAIVWLDEYKNNLPVKFIESLKNIYDGKGYERGKMTNDFATESTPIYSSCLLSGQDMPTQEPALFMRVIMLAFDDGKFTNEQREAFGELKNTYESNGLSFITADIFRHRKIINDGFKDKLQLIFKEVVKDVSNTEVDDRMMMNISILLTYMHLLHEVVEFPFTFKDAKAFLIDNMLKQHYVLAGNNDVAKFWGVVESLFYQDIIHENKDFLLEDGYLYLPLMKVYPLYLKELRSRNDPNILSKSTMEHYLKLDPTMYVEYTRKRFSDGSNNYCYKMKYSKLGIDMIRIVQNAMESNEQLEVRMEKVYKEMGVDITPNNSQSVKKEDNADDMPF